MWTTSRRTVLAASMAIGLFSSALTPALSADEGFYRYGVRAGDGLVFSSEGDLWHQAKGTKTAVRLTTHDGWEGRAHVSPDGKMIAFVASLDTAWQVYVMPVEGGRPEQVTFGMTGVQVRGWSPDGRILYTSRDIPGSSRVRELRLVDPKTKDVERIPLRYATTGAFSKDGDTLFFVRHGMATVSDNARLYRGGGTAQLWRWNMGSTAEAIRLAPDFTGPIDHPMVWKNRIYFISDQSGWDNIWSMKPDGSDIKQHTKFENWRLQDPTLTDGEIIYQRGADLYAYDIKRKRETKLEIDLLGDEDRSRTRWLKKPMQYVTAASLGANGKKAAITARGEVLIASANKSRRIELSLPAKARARRATLSHDGKTVYLILGQDAQSEIWAFAADGSDTGTQLTTDADHHRWDLRLSPDGKTLFHTDKAGRLFALTLETLENKLLLKANSASDDPFDMASLSPDGRYIAISEALVNRSLIKVIDLETGEEATVTSDKYASYEPSFSADGNWLYFLSDRNFRPTPGSPWGDRNMGVRFDKRGEIFALDLKGDQHFPFAPKTELDLKAEAAEKKAAEEKKKAEKEANAADAESAEDNADSDESAKTPAIDWAAAAKRLYRVPVAPDNYATLDVVKGRLYTLVRSGRGGSLNTIKITADSPKVETFMGGVTGYELSPDGKTMLVGKRGPETSFYIVPAGAKAPGNLGKAKVRTEGWRLEVSPKDEWVQQFLDGWRMHRDFSFDPEMRGVDWVAVRDQLLPLAARIGDRTELDNLFGQMAYPLGILHSQIVGGDTTSDGESADQASLGAHFKPVDGGVAITHIYGHEFERPQTAGPLQRPGVDVRVGDVITHINSVAVSDLESLNRALFLKTGEEILIDFSRDGETHQEIVRPVGWFDHTRLRYQDWVLANAAKTRTKSDGKIGYLHLRAMGGGDVASFARDFFAQNHLDGMIIDVRDNNGGNIDSIIINQLLRKVWAFWAFESQTYGNMQETFRGHLAVLVNEGTYSDGDTFAAAIKTLELAPLIGERTAGAGIWLSGRNNLTDWGRARIAETPQYRLDGEWFVEGTGVSPTMEVVAGPHALFNGEDAQIDAAVAYLLDKIEKEPIQTLTPKPLPKVGEHGVDAVPLKELNLD